MSSGKKEDGAPAKSGAPAPHGAAHWSDDPIDLSALGSTEGNLTVHIGTLKLTQTTLSDIDTTIRLANNIHSPPRSAP